MTDQPSFKPVIWVGSSRKDLREFADIVQDHVGYALYVAQQGGKHRDAKTLTGFGAAGVGVFAPSPDFELRLML